MMPQPLAEPVTADAQEEENESLEAARSAARTAADRDKRLRKKERQREKKAAEQAKKLAEDEGRRAQEAARKAQASSQHSIDRQCPRGLVPAYRDRVRSVHYQAALRRHVQSSLLSTMHAATCAHMVLDLKLMQRCMPC